MLDESKSENHRVPLISRAHPDPRWEEVFGSKKQPQPLGQRSQAERHSRVALRLTYPEAKNLFDGWSHPASLSMDSVLEQSFTRQHVLAFAGTRGQGRQLMPQSSHSPSPNFL